MLFHFQVPFYRTNRAHFAFFGILLALTAGSACPSGAVSLTLDDFEAGVANWATNDKTKTADAAATLVNIIPVPPDPGGSRGSKGAALFTFKAAKASWASASLKVNGGEWAKMGAQNLVFWLNAGGEDVGFEVILRGTGTPSEEKFVLKKKVELDRRGWRLVSIPLTDFRSEKGALPGRLSNVYLLQFAQTGDWNSRFFMVDDIRIDGTGRPIPQVAVTPPPTPTPTPSLTNDKGELVTTVNVDFLKKDGKIRTAGNVSVGATWPNINGTEVFPFDNRAYRDSIAVLKPRLVRLDAGSLSALVDSSRPSFEFARLVSAVKQVRELKAEPLVALPNPAAWGLDEKGYASFAAQAARAVNSGVVRVRLFEVALAIPGGTAGDDAQYLAYYNRAYEALKAASRSNWVGGLGASGGKAGTLTRLLGSARGLDFLSLQFTSPVQTPGQTPGGDAIFKSAQSLLGLKYAANQLDKSRFNKAPIFVTQANLSEPGPDGEQPADARANQMASAPWWITFLGSGSRVADQVFHNDGANSAWGLLDGANSAPRGYPAFYALYLWNNFVPASSDRVRTDVSNPAITAIGLNPPLDKAQPLHTVLLANTTETEQTVKVSIRGFPVLRETRVRVFDDLAAARDLSTYQVLPKSPFQTLTLKPYAVVVMQFVEPPKK